MSPRIEREASILERLKNLRADIDEMFEEDTDKAAAVASIDCAVHAFQMACKWRYGRELREGRTGVTDIMRGEQ